MGVLSRLFGDPQKAKAEEIIRNVERRHRPVSHLAQSILVGSFSCGEKMQPHLIAPTRAATDALYPAVCYEFIFFFAHMLNRYALSILGADGRMKLQDEIGPLIVVPAISGFFDHWPEDRKAKLVDDFYGDMSAAELDYSSCRELVPSSVQVLFREILDDSDSPAKCLVSKLISRIFNLSGKSLSPEAVTFLFDVSTKALLEMKLEQHVREIKEVL